MNNLVLQCREKALKLSNSEDPPRYENGRKIGYMRLMKDFWEELGMEHLELTSQNLRDLAAVLDKSIGSVAGNIASRVGRRRRSAGGREGNEAEEEVNLERDNSQYANEQQRIGANLHTENSENQTMPHEEFINTLTQGERELFEKSAQLYTLVNTREGDYSNREIDTRIKQKPTQSDLKSINRVLKGLLEQKKTLSLNNDPFAHLWLVNCVLYSVVEAFLLLKGWKKDPKDKLDKQRVYNGEKWKKNYLDEMGEITKNISIASAEVNRVKENRKLTKRGRKNRALLQEECKSLSATQLITYIEKQKFRLSIVSRGDWLGNPANFKGAVCCLASEVETYHHVTMTLHKLTAVQNNMADVNDLFFFGDDFDAVLDILEIDEELEEQFTEAVDEVSMRKLFNTLYEPKIWL